MAVYTSDSKHASLSVNKQEGGSLTTPRTDWLPSFEAECDERLLLAHLAFDEFGERQDALHRLRATNFSWRYRPWFTAIEALHAGPEQINIEALLALVGANGIDDPLDEWRLMCAELPSCFEAYEPLEQIANRVIANSRRQWFIRSMQSALQHAQRGKLAEFDEAIATASRLLHQLSGQPATSRPYRSNTKRQPMTFDQRQHARTRQLGGRH